MEGTKIEKGPEKIFNKQEVLQIIGQFAERTEVIEEILDQQGLLFRLTTKSEGENPGDTNEYEYMRKGRIEGGEGGTTVTTIHVVYYQGGIPTGGEPIAEYNDETGVWQFFDQSH